MNKKEILIIFGTAHLATTPGKCSPDGRLKEYSYSRERVKAIACKLRAYGYNVAIDIEEDKLPKTMRTPSAKLEQSRELGLRANVVNQLCKQYTCIYVSIHVNAAGADGKWKNAGGWCAYTSVGNTKADVLAEHLYKAAEKNLKEYASLMGKGKATGGYSGNQVPIRMDRADGDKDYESNFYVLAHTSCPAVLTENMFQDNKLDVDWLLSDAGMHAIERLHVEGILSYIESLK